MVLKKPYAFLIRYFKVIHLILLAIISYITFRFSRIVNFFISYVSNSNIISENTVRSYFPFTIFLAFLIVITFSVLMWLLMYKKRKPSKFYLFLGLYYFILLIVTIYAYGIMKDLSSATTTQQASRAYRDIFELFIVPNFYFIVMSFIRGIGFDVKKFNFSKDLEELEIKSEDNEEFEFVLGTDSYKLKRKTRRYFRELKYYFLENKLFILAIVGFASLALLMVIILNVTFINHVYKVGETLKTSTFTYKLNSAYITSYDYRSNEIKEDKKYIILNFNIKSNYESTALKPEHFYLTKNGNVINYKTSLSDSFSDLGLSYNNDKISTEYNNYIFVFEVDKSIKSNTYILNVFDKTKYNKDGSTDYKYEIYKIKPEKIDNIYNEEEKKLNEKIELNKKIFGNTNITIKSVKIKNSYEYRYQDCDLENNCKSTYSIEFPTNTTKNDLMVIEYELNIDENSPIYTSTSNNPKKFFDKFLKISYQKNDKLYYKPTVSKTNSNLKNIIFTDVTKSLQNTDSYGILISTRTDNYYIKIK